ncbi:MAG: hypothetical protein HFF30_02690 [Flavonifractor sp.]|jgi:hypothetical protein|nr:hypothetical protein [Flavonifractor sp.]
MDILALIAAFGGGVIGAYMGAVPAFVMTGVFALVGGVATAAGVDGGVAINSIAFGSFLGPHIAFAGGVAAAGYAGKQKKLASGADVVSSLNGLGEPDVLLVGGIFGVIGFVLAALIGAIPLGALGTLGTLTDLPGICVVISGIIVRFVFGTTGLTGKYTGSGPRVWFSTGKGLLCNIILGGGLGCAVAFVGATLYTAGNEVALGIFPIICFGFSATTLLFACGGLACPATHHIALPAGLATVVGLHAFQSPAGAVLGVLFGILGALGGDLAGNSINSHVDTHIDPPATTIFILTIVVNLIGKALGV